MDYHINWQWHEAEWELFACWQRWASIFDLTKSIGRYLKKHPLVVMNLSRRYLQDLGLNFSATHADALAMPYEMKTMKTTRCLIYNLLVHAFVPIALVILVLSILTTSDNCHFFYTSYVKSNYLQCVWNTGQKEILKNSNIDFNFWGFVLVVFSLEWLLMLFEDKNLTNRHLWYYCKHIFYWRTRLKTFSLKGWENFQIEIF